MKIVMIIGLMASQFAQAQSITLRDQVQALRHLYTKDVTAHMEHFVTTHTSVQCDVQDQVENRSMKMSVQNLNLRTSTVYQAKTVNATLVMIGGWEGTNFNAHFDGQKYTGSLRQMLNHSGEAVIANQALNLWTDGNVLGGEWSITIVDGATGIDLDKIRAAPASFADNGKQASVFICK